MHVYLCVCLCMHVCVHMYVCACMCTCGCVRVYMCACVHQHVCACVRAYMFFLLKTENYIVNKHPLAIHFLTGCPFQFMMLIQLDFLMFVLANVIKIQLLLKVTYLS